VRHTLADVSAAGRSLDYKPKVNFREGMAHTVSYFVERARVGHAMGDPA
jgi:nucleoside-diphosphate-sugar epimerase